MPKLKAAMTIYWRPSMDLPKVIIHNLSLSSVTGSSAFKLRSFAAGETKTDGSKLEEVTWKEIVMPELKNDLKRCVDNVGVSYCRDLANRKVQKLRFEGDLFGVRWLVTDS